MEDTHVTLSVDMKKHRIRLHKVTYRLIGQPKYIQLLVNPNAKAVAVRAVEKMSKDNQAYRINKVKMESDHSFEIYSRSFCEKLWELTEGLESGYSYRMNGKVFLSQNTAVFSLKTLHRTER
ncbi:MAG: hypothetical protein IJT79_05245 [Ruminococcus sp.]|nr:hypothetical protein [Ruminococcus sp.]